MVSASRYSTRASTLFPSAKALGISTFASLARFLRNSTQFVQAGRLIPDPMNGTKTRADKALQDVKRHHGILDLVLLFPYFIGRVQAIQL